MRYAVRVEPLASAEVSDVIDLVAPRLQSYIDEASVGEPDRR